MNKLERITKWIYNYGLAVCDIIVSGFGFAAIGVFYEHGEKLLFGVKYEVIGFWLFIIVVILNLLIGFFLFKKAGKMSKLEEDINRLNSKIQLLENDTDQIYAEYSLLFSEQLALMSKELDFTGNERISVYRHESNKFFVVGRYSENPKFNKVRERTHSSNEGFISKAWASQSGEFLELNIPEHDPQNVNTYNNYVKSKCSITVKKLNAKRMKSRGYYLKVINDNLKINRSAIIVFESLDLNKLDKTKIDTLLTRENTRITSFITKMRFNNNRPLENPSSLGL